MVHWQIGLLAIIAIFCNIETSIDMLNQTTSLFLNLLSDNNLQMRSTIFLKNNVGKFN